MSSSLYFQGSIHIPEIHKRNIASRNCHHSHGLCREFSFVVQDAVQGHHWNNRQTALHPFTVYYKEGQKLKHAGLYLAIFSIVQMLFMPSYHLSFFILK